MKKLFFSVLNNPTLNANFKLQHLKAAFFLIMNMEILIILKMPFLVFSPILDPLLILVSVNYFGILI